ncbi:TMEM9 Family Protein [Frankliniella occidentalis]|uniref:Uncharacterized protein CG1161 n=1 Tax=Frankliniella occidentalis TaxID=133901 RepID=A0A6J1SNQ2_FRAOC|nr:uncharacterized protein CG1161 [Frankliniella occidentalis]KAE8752737.1 TMEM9 Family Protein [Frankliniella occidentalis]
MWMKIALIFVFVAFVVTNVTAQIDNDARCKCLCPSLPLPESNETRKGNQFKQYKGDPDPSQCTCRDVVLPKLSDAEKAGLPPEFCVRCDCKYENRNTTIIKVVVIIVIWIISLLVVYMLFLICLDPLLNKRVQSNYTEHTNEDEMSGGEGVSHAMGVRSNVLNRVGHQQDKWKRQVREQRRNIYDRHTMLN